MDRREFLKSTAGVAALSGAAVAPAAAAGAAGRRASVSEPRPDATVIPLHVTWRAAAGGPSESARRLADRVRLLSGGALVFEVAESLSDLSGLTTAAPGAVLGSAHDLVAIDRAFAYFAGLPADAGLGRHDTAAWLKAGGGDLLIDELAEAHGLVTMLAGSSGQRATLWSARAIADPGELAGMRIYAEGLGRDVVRALGADAQDIAPGSLSSSLAAGQLDAVQWGGPIASYDAGLPAAAGHAMVHGLTRYGAFTALTLTRQTWLGLTPAEQAIIATAAAEELQTTTAEARAYDPVMRKALSQVHGVAFSEPQRAFRFAVGRVTDAIVAHVAGQSAEARRIDASYMAFRDTVRGKRRNRPAESLFGA